MSSSCLQKLKSVEFMTDFINLYRSLPALWKVKSADYSNCFKKEEAYKKMVDLTRTVYENADMDFVKSKINTIRGCYRKELNKVLASKRSGASLDDLYVPKLWYYELLAFTSDQELPRQLKSSMPAVKSTGAGQRGCDIEGPESHDEEKNIQDSPQPTSPQNRSTKRKRGAKSQNTKEHVLAKTEKALHRDELDSYFESVAAKMRRMSERQRLFVEKVINEAVFLGALNRLTEYSDVNTPTTATLRHEYTQRVYSNQGTASYRPTSPSEPSPSASPGSGTYILPE